MAASIKKIAIDSSFVLSYLLPDEKTEKIDKVFEEYCQGAIELISTELLPFEVLNAALKTSVARKRIDKETALKLSEAFLNLDIKLEEVDLKESLNLALEKNLTVYDASYLSLALSQNLPLLTHDTDLKKRDN